MATSFDSNEPIALFATRSGLILDWKWFLIGGLAALYADSYAPDAMSGKLLPKNRNQMNLGIVVAVIGLGGAGLKNWRRVKWIRTADRGGIEWSAGMREYHRDWNQMTGVHTEDHMVMVVGQDEQARLVAQTLTVSFDDGVCFRVRNRDVIEYSTLVVYLESKQVQTTATGQSAQNAKTHAKAEQEKTDVATAYGPLTISRNGVEWVGIYTPWEQIESCELDQGILLIKTVSGDEFFRRTAELGDWRTAIDRIKAARGRMAGRRQAVAH